MALKVILERVLKANEENLEALASEKMFPKKGQKMKKAFCSPSPLHCRLKTSGSHVGASGKHLKHSEVEAKEVVFQNKLLIKHLRGKQQPLPDYGSLPQEPPIMV